MAIKIKSMNQNFRVSQELELLLEFQISGLRNLQILHLEFYQFCCRLRPYSASAVA